MLTILALFLVPVAARAALFAFEDRPRSFGCGSTVVMVNFIHGRRGSVARTCFRRLASSSARQRSRTSGRCWSEPTSCVAALNGCPGPVRSSRLRQLAAPQPGRAQRSPCDLRQYFSCGLGGCRAATVSRSWPRWIMALAAASTVGRTSWTPGWADPPTRERATGRSCRGLSSAAMPMDACVGAPTRGICFHWTGRRDSSTRISASLAASDRASSASQLSTRASSR